MKNEIVYNIRPDLASKGFQAAIRLMSTKLRKSESNTVKWLANELYMEEFRLLEYLRSTGLPKHLVNTVLAKMRELDIPFARYQLYPTKSIISMYCTNVD